MVDVPEFEESKLSYEESEDYDEVEAYKMAESDVGIETYGTELASVDDVLPEVDVLELEPVVEEVLSEKPDVISEEVLDYGVNEPATVVKSYEQINELIEVVDEAYADLQNFDTTDMTKECYETLTDKEKVEWLGIAECSVQDAIQKFISKLDSIGVIYRYSDDMLDEFMKLESVVAQMKREQEKMERNAGSEGRSR